ncbi:MAG TPA: sulfatase [Actinomycetota bacterium]|nr:sulfatase [Actinomycetota bacterium]
MSRTSDLPNVVLVVFDTARRDRFGCYGYGRPTTPTTDSLAREGLVFETMISNAPWTLPAHGSLFTGLYPTEHGSQWQTGPALRDAVPLTMAEFLKGIGYDTWCVTNNGLISSRTRLARGFDTYAARLDIERGLRRMARRVPKALVGGDSGGKVVNAWMRRRLPRARRPMFLFVNYVECHWSYAPPPSMVRRVGGPRHRALEGLRYRTGVAAKAGPWEAVARADERGLEVLSTLYDGEVADVDRHLNGLLGVLEESGHLRQPTIVIVASDHGEHLGERGLADHHASLDDLLLRVPFVVWGPGVIGGARRVPETFEFVDVLPSLVQLLDQPMPDHLAGRRTGVFDGEGDGNPVSLSEWRAWSKSELRRLKRRNPSFDFTGLRRDLACARDDRFKLVRGSDGSAAVYDLRADPVESADVSAAHPDAASRLAKALDAAIPRWAGWEAAGAAQITAAEEQEIEARLEELGYI